MLLLSEAKPIILIVEDDLDIAEMLDAYFRVQGYEVLTASAGEEAINQCATKLADLVILDIRLPDIDGFEVARRLRTQRRTKDVPIIFLTERRNRGDRMYGLELGADDYITKPFDIQELRLRVRNALRRVSSGTLINPVTNLPEGTLVDERLTECLQRDDWGLVFITIDHLDAFRESYGFVASDDVLRAIALMIKNTVEEENNEQDFVGQFGPTEFVVLTKSRALPALRNHIQMRLEQSLDYFYPLKDRNQEDSDAYRLVVRLNLLTARQGPFTDLDHLKSRLAPHRI